MELRGGHRRNSSRPRIGDQTGSQPFRRDPLLHSLGGSLEVSGAALAGANRLAAMAPAAGHIVHMPAHVYIRNGRLRAAVKTNQDAAAVDQAYIKRSGAQGNLSPDVLQSQPALHRHVCSHEWRTTLKPTKMPACWQLTWRPMSRTCRRWKAS